MPIIDHFSPKIRRMSHFHSFHNAWATNIAADLNALLPENFIAEPKVQLGSLGEIDVQADEPLDEDQNPLIRQYQIPRPTASVPASFPDEMEVYIVNLDAARRTVGVIEIVSPSNKDRPQNRDIFIAKCLSLISQGITLVLVDIVTVRLFNFHNELMRRLESTDGQVLETEAIPLYCSAYRYILNQEHPRVECWAYPLAVGDALPELPLFISSQIAVPVRLERTYLETRQKFRVGVE
ncbi:MAG: DUF4058 family protein [Candidatus Poribacteria bacterium]|nr:DUF4058 family protein [Candidatus Poribacteria bacterium]